MKVYFPMFIDLTQKKILVVGGGAIAARRVNTLVKSGASPVIVAKAFTDVFRSETDFEAIKTKCIEREYVGSDLDECEIAIIATDDHELNKKIAAECRERGIMKNVSTDQTLCDFFFPSVVMTDEVVVGICSGGTSPSVTKKTRIKIEKLLNE